MHYVFFHVAMLCALCFFTCLCDTLSCISLWKILIINVVLKYCSLVEMLLYDILAV